MHLSPIEWILAVATPVVQIAILTAMWKRKFRVTFPIFFNYIAFTLLTNIFLTTFITRISSVQYFYAYWSIAAVGMFLGFGALYEVFVHILKPYSALVDLGKLLFRWVVVFLLLASVLTAVVTSGSQPHKICTAVQLAERSISLMQCGFLLLLVLFEARLGLSWRSPAVCIAIGIGVMAALDLSVSYLTEKMPGWGYGLSVLTGVNCVIVHSCWLVSLMLPQPQRKTALDSPTRLIFQRWNEALLATPLVKRTPSPFPVESFLPGVEQTVERVMARKMH